MIYEDFLLEIGCEELPTRAQPVLTNALKQDFEQALAELALGFDEIHPYSTPRRLAILIKRLQTETLPNGDGKDRIRGPFISVAEDAQGVPTAAGLGFARSCGVDYAQLSRETTSKGDRLYYIPLRPAQKTAELLPALCEKIIAALPIAKRMRWGEGDISFVRPVHWIVLMLGHEVIPAQILGRNSDRLTYGHRFHHPQAIRLEHPKEYESVLKKAHVIANADERRHLIKEALEKIAAMVQGVPGIDVDLLNEVTAIVEWPVPLLCQFDPHFLTVPHEALILAMQQHQKAFCIQDKQQQLLPYFITVSNINSGDPNEVIRGNERVMNARLADAKFFFDTDRKHSLAFMAKRLSEIIFYAGLGSLQDKAERIATLAKTIALFLGLNGEEAHRAGLLCKADLVSDMVGEFPELQGIMGGYYAAAHNHETPAVAKAIAEHYQPRFAKDTLPISPLGAVVAIADKIDTVVGIFGVGEIPKGDKDPFALRRLALGVLKIIVEKQWPLNLEQLLQNAASFYGDKLKSTNLVPQVFDFMMERFKNHFIEEGVSAEIFMAVLAKHPVEPYDFSLRLRAVQAFCQLPQSEALAAANKRVSRILEKEANILTEHKVQEKLLLEPAEKALWQALEEKKKVVLPLYETHEYTKALSALALLQPIIDDFFDSTMVMVEDRALRENRLALLQQLYDLFSVVADLSCL